MPDHPPNERRAVPRALPPRALVFDSDSQATVVRDEMWYAVPVVRRSSQ